MARTARLFAAAVLAAMALAPRGPAQAPDLAPPPRMPPAETPEFDPLPGLPHPPDQPRSLLAPAPAGPLYDSAALPGPYFQPDALLDPPQLPAPGWFADVEAEIAKAHVQNKLTNASIPNGGAPDVIQLPSATLDVAVAPRFEIGRRLESGFGAIAFSYRFLVTQGNDVFVGPDGPAALKSRLDLNIADFDYISREFSLWPKADMKWRFGLRYADVYFDSRADESLAAAAAGSGVFERRVSDSFWGLGPHSGVEVDRRLEGTGLSLFAKADGWIDLGRVRQGFFEAPTAPGSATEETRASSSQSVPVLNLQAGARWQPAGLPNAEFFLGYEYEYWWNVGRFSLTPDSRGDLFDQGVMLRATFNF